MNDRDKQQILIITACTVAVLGLFYWLVIRTELHLLEQTHQQMTEMRQNAEITRALAAQREHWEEKTVNASNRLSELERELPAGDIYRWQLQRFLNPKAPGITIADVEPPKTADPLLSGTNVPYGTVSFGLTGRGRFHEAGRFLADLENRYLHMRVETLEIQPTMPDAIQSEEARRLFFQIQFLSLTLSPSPAKP